jgi:hypothetical protein
MKKNNLYIFVLLAAITGIYSCSTEEAEKSKITSFNAFSFGIADKLSFKEADTVMNIPFTFDDNQIFDVDVEVKVNPKSTATEGVDFLLNTKEISVLTLVKKGVIELELGSDLFLEQDEKIFLDLVSKHPSGLPKTKTIEVTLENVGGCPSYVHSNFVGDYEVVSDGWDDWKAGTIVKVSSEGSDVLSFKYNCGAKALPILMKVNPATFGISGTKQEYCSYDLPPVLKFSGDIVEATSSVNTCDKIIKVTIAHTDEKNVSYGSAAIVLKKK